MDILHPQAVIGTNSWGSAAYGVMLRGSYVDDSVIQSAMSMAGQCDLMMYDLARDYGFGKAQKMIGSFGTDEIFISAKYTPVSSYKPGCVRKSLEKDLEDFRRDYVDVYWLHLPSQIGPHLEEIIELQKEGKIRHIGVSNFNLEECMTAKKILDDAGLKLYGVQNHYSLISREWEKNGLVEWCKDNDILFWAWAVLEEGMLVDPRKKTKKTLLKLIFGRQKRKMGELFKTMMPIADAHGLTVSQVAIAFCANKGIVPICGCRKPKQVEELSEAVKTVLSDEEMRELEKAADRTEVRIMGPDLFRSFVRKK